MEENNIKDLVKLVGKEVFNALKEAFELNKLEKVRVAIIGQTGVGKTSTINALFNTNLPVSHFGSCTQESKVVTVKTDKAVIEVIDMPGLWAGESESKKHWETYRKILPTVDSAVWVISAGDRALEGMQSALKIISSFSDENIINKIVFGINKSEHMHPEDWNVDLNLPSKEQEQNLENFCLTVKSAIQENFPNWNGVVKYYSAKKQFRLYELLEQMIIMASPDDRLKISRAANPKSQEEMVKNKMALELAKDLIDRGEI